MRHVDSTQPTPQRVDTPQASQRRGSAPATSSQAHRHLPSTPALFARQLGFDFLAQLRNPSTMVFTLALPLLFLVAFTVTTDRPAEAAEYYVPTIMVMALASGTLTNLAVTLTYLREYGQLKRVLVTPLPRLVFLGSRVMAGAFVAGLTVLLLGAVGVWAYGVAPQHPGLLAVTLTMIFLQGSFLGVAVTVVLRSEMAAAPLANAICLPLLMASGVFFPLSTLPQWFADVARFLPFTGLVEGATGAYLGLDDASSALREALLVPGTWALAAAVVAIVCFRWAPVHRR